MRADDVRDPLPVEAGTFDVRDDLLRAHARADVDERELRSPVEQVDVAVVRIAEVEAERARADEVDALGELHRN